MRSACGDLYGEDDVPPDIQRIGREIDRVAFEVLAGRGGAIGYSDMKAVLDDLVANYRDEVVADIENLESFGDRREVLIDLVSRVELLCERSTGTNELLGAWRMVGYAMAALVAVLSRRGYDFPRAAGGDDASLRKVLAPLRQAISRLPTAEAARLNSMLPKLLPVEPRWLAGELVTTFRSAIEFLDEKSRTSASLGAGLAPSYIGSPQQSGASDGVVDRAERLPRSAKLAWSQFRQAELELGDGVEDKKAYAWLVEERDMSWPPKETWYRHVGTARKMLGKNKNHPKQLPDTGGSIVRIKEI